MVIIELSEEDYLALVDDLAFAYNSIQLLITIEPHSEIKKEMADKAIALEHRALRITEQGSSQIRKS